ncbi:S24 family peptidase [Croceicoccus sp. BE223]|uniref:S24 family peptidase n=1 Tax=Croceicoccus sp. BE223 TaxID=2817716 RepID=UPI00285E2EAA|nr:S24 family peptidase [Croceicoccus sp. BE223]MDR7102966.1 phage repressor protein C with HTH and peptisase S24 domain [Croceicoccus sp. BE223]
MEISDRKQHGIIKDIERKGTMPGADRIRRIAEVLETTTDYLLGTVSTSEQVQSEVGIQDLGADARDLRRTPDRAEPGIPLLGTGDCADLELGDDIHIERSSFDEDYHVRMIERPPSLRGARQAYAIYFQGSSMEPRFYAGEIGIVDPDRPAAPGDFVVVQLNNGEAEHVVSVLVKRLVRQTSQYVELEQFNPQTVFQLPRRKVARIHKIMPPTDLLFR